jgi:hypothetical protein
MKLGILILMVLSIGTQPTAPPLVFPTPVLAMGYVGVAYSQTLTATGGVPPYRWMEDNPSTLPPGLTLGTSTGIISGTPTQTGLFNVHIQVADSKKPAQRVQRNVPMSVGVASTPAD